MRTASAWIMELKDSLEEFEIVAAVFEKLDIEYQLGGSIASSIHGFPRGTQDVDVEADLNESHVAALVELLEERYVIAPETVREAIRLRGCFNLIPFDSIAKIDVFIRKNRPFDQQAAGRRQKGLLLEDGTTFPFYVDSPEDTILRKLEWYRMGDEVAHQKWLDVLAVMKAQFFDLDLAYLEKWSRELKVGDLLERALDESGLTEKE